jgi:Zn finger protein HypA/HybF involved in hydrogenase expression
MSRESQCIHCGSKTEKVHQNNELTIRDLPFGEQALDILQKSYSAT